MRGRESVESRISTLSDRHTSMRGSKKGPLYLQGFQYQGKNPVVSSESSGGDTSKIRLPRE